MSVLEGPPEGEHISGNIAEKMVRNLLKVKDRIVEANLRNGRTLTAKTLLIKASVIAQELVDNIHDGVALMYCHSCLEELYVMLACLMVAVPLLILDAYSERTELKRLIFSIQPKVIFTDKATMENVKKEKFADKLQRCYILDDVQNFQKIFRNKPTDVFKPVKVDDPKETVAFLLISEGTTAAPRISMVSHYAMDARVSTFMELLPEGCVSVVSYFYTKLPIRTATLMENVMRIIPPPFSAKSCAKLLHDMKVDVAFLASILGQQLLEYLTTEEAIKLPRLKKIVFGGVPITLEIMDGLQAVLPNSQIANLYLSNECGLISSYTRTSENVHAGMTTCCGRLFSGVKIKITNFITKEAMPARKWGELWFSGPGLAMGYFDVGDFRRKMANNYFRTGDVAYVDDAGLVYLKGRTQDILVVDDHVFSTVDVEEILTRNDDVVECACFTRGPHSILLVVTKTEDVTAEDIFEWLQGVMEPYMLPDKIFILNHLPQTRSGKVKKYLLEPSKHNKGVES